MREQRASSGAGYTDAWHVKLFDVRGRKALRRGRATNISCANKQYVQNDPLLRSSSNCIEYPYGTALAASGVTVDAQADLGIAVWPRSEWTVSTSASTTESKTAGGIARHLDFKRADVPATSNDPNELGTLDIVLRGPPASTRGETGSSVRNRHIAANSPRHTCAHDGRRF